MILRYNPDRHIDYDSGLGILDSVDEYDRFERMYYTGECSEMEEDLLRAYQFSQPKDVRESMPVQVPYRHLVSVVQIASGFDSILSILKRTEHLVDMEDADIDLLQERVSCVRYWLENFAPDMVRFSILEQMPELDLNEDEMGFLHCILAAMGGMEWEGDGIHNAVYECSKSSGLGARNGFQLMYQIFIGRRSGPRLGHFLSTLDRDFVLGRIRKALS